MMLGWGHPGDWTISEVWTPIESAPTIKQSDARVVEPGTCPLCGSPTTRGSELSGDPDDDTPVCENCGWDTYPRCAHGILESEFCVQCPHGGV